MNLQPYNLNYQDGLNTYPIIDYINDQIGIGSGGGSSGGINSYVYLYQTSNLMIANNTSNSGIYFRVYNSPNATNGNYAYSVKIDKDGKLYVYHLYDVLNPTMGAGWYDVEKEIANAIFNTIQTNIQFLAIEGEIVVLTGAIATNQTNFNNFKNLTNASLIKVSDSLEVIGNSFQALTTEATTDAIFRASGSISAYVNNSRALFSVQRTFIDQMRVGLGNVANVVTNPFLVAGVGVTAGLLGMILGNNSFNYNDRFDTNSNGDFTLDETTRAEVRTSNYSNMLGYTSNFLTDLSNANITFGFINSNVTTSQFIPTLKSDKVMLGNITTPNASYQMEMTGDLNTNMLYINSTSLTSLLNQKQNNLTPVAPLYITTGNIGISYDSTLLLTSGVLGVNIPAESKWRYTGGNIYNKDFTNVGIGTVSIQSRLHLHNGTANTECQIRFTNAQSGNNSATDGVYMGLDASSPYNFQIDSRSATGQIQFRTGNTLRATLKSNGCLGVGVPSPQQLLSVAGKIESTNGNNDKIYFSYDDTNNYRHRIYGNFDSGATDNNYIQFYNWRYGQGSTAVGDKSVATFHNKYTRFDGNRYFWINDRINDYGGNDYTSTPLTIFNQTASSSTVLNDPQRVLSLVRQGFAGQTYGQSATFKLSRYENSSTDARTRLDLDLGDTNNTDVNVMCIRSDGKVGFGTTNPQVNFNVHGRTMVGGFCSIKISSATTGNATNQGLNLTMAEDGTSYLWNNSVKPLIFATSNTERMRISDVGNVGINITAPNAYGKLQVSGVVNFHAGTPVAVPNNYMSSGSLTIGDTAIDYGNGTGWNTNTAGLLLECKDKTEIVVHDSGNRLASLINFVGGSSSYHEYGRAYGYGHPNAHYFRCNQTFECYFANAVGGWNYFKVEPTSLWGDGLVTASDQGGTKYLTIRNIMLQAPHIVPETVGGVAFIRLGRAGGVQAGTWWELSTGVAGTFRIIKEQDYKYGITISQRGNIGVANDAPIDVSGDTNACSLNLGKCGGGFQHRARIQLVKDDNNGSVRQMLLTQDNLFNFCIADGGGQNNLNTVVLIVQVKYNAPYTSLYIDVNGYVQMRMGYGTSDQRTKTNIKTIDDALFKVLHLRGVEYNDIEIGDRRIGLIAQEVEGVIPEVVHTNEDTGVKSLAYGNMTGLLVNAIKELNELVVKQNNLINNLMERIERLEGTRNGTS